MTAPRVASGPSVDVSRSPLRRLVGSTRAGHIGRGGPRRRSPATRGGTVASADGGRERLVRTPALLVKRAIDIIGASVGLAVLAPILAWSAVGVAATLGLPVFFRQRRPGLHGEPFEIVKFRTMRTPRPGEVW